MNKDGSDSTDGPIPGHSGKHRGSDRATAGWRVEYCGRCNGLCSGPSHSWLLPLAGRAILGSDGNLQEML